MSRSRRNEHPSDDRPSSGARLQGDHKVSHAEPPLERRFKDQSDNLKGRPKGSKNRKTIMREVAGEMHTVVENGKKCRRSTLHLMLLALRNRAMQGDVRAVREMEKYLTKYEPQDVKQEGGFLVVPAEKSPQEWIRDEEELNKTRKPPEGWRGRNDSETE